MYIRFFCFKLLAVSEYNRCLFYFTYKLHRILTDQLTSCEVCKNMICNKGIHDNCSLKDILCIYTIIFVCFAKKTDYILFIVSMLVFMQFKEFETARIDGYLNVLFYKMVSITCGCQIMQRHLDFSKTSEPPEHGTLGRCSFTGLLFYRFIFSHAFE